MNSTVEKIWKKIIQIVDKYPAVIAAVLIYAYYLATSINIFKHRGDQTIADYFFQYSSLFFLWVTAWAVIHLLKVRRANKREELRRHEIERALDRQQIHERLVNDITMLLQDNVNNPLAVISVTTREIRRKFEKDVEILKWLDRIESSIQRIHNTIRDIQAYEANKILQATTDALKGNYEMVEEEETAEPAKVK